MNESQTLNWSQFKLALSLTVSFPKGPRVRFLIMYVASLLERGFGPTGSDRRYPWHHWRAEVDVTRATTLDAPSF
jgi:hypothetical protein